MTAAAALAPVTGRLRLDAQQQAARLRSAARTEAAAVVAQARRQAAQIAAEAEAAATTIAVPLAAAELRRARDAAKTAVLTAQREACDELRSQVRAAVAALPAQPGYDQLIQRVTVLASAAAGPDAQLAPAPGGGVTARSAGVIVDCSLGHLADLAVVQLGPAIRDLWAP